MGRTAGLDSLYLTQAGMDVSPYRHRRLWLVVGAGLVIAVIVLSLIPIKVDLSEGRDKWSHGLAYGALMFWFGLLYARALPRLGLALAFAAMGVGLEFLQGMTGYRSFEIDDMKANAVGVAIGWLLVQTPLQGLLLWFEKCLPRTGG